MAICRMSVVSVLEHIEKLKDKKICNQIWTR